MPNRHRSAASVKDYHIINLGTVLGAYNPERDEELWRAYKAGEYSADEATNLYIEALAEEGVDFPHEFFS